MNTSPKPYLSSIWRKLSVAFIKTTSPLNLELGLYSSAIISFLKNEYTAAKSSLSEYGTQPFINARNFWLISSSDFACRKSSSAWNFRKIEKWKKKYSLKIIISFRILQQTRIFAYFELSQTYLFQIHVFEYDSKTQIRSDDFNQRVLSHISRTFEQFRMLDDETRRTIQQKQMHYFAVRLQLESHFEGDGGAERVSGQIIRSSTLNFFNVLKVWKKKILYKR